MPHVIWRLGTSLNFKKEEKKHSQFSSVDKKYTSLDDDLVY